MTELESLFLEWIRSISRTSPAPAEIAAFNIGVFETPTGYSLYLVGSKHFDPESDDWATQEDYSPRDRYLELPASVVKNKNWLDVEQEVIRVVRNFVQSTRTTVDLLTGDSIVTVGFDDGNLVRIR